MALQIQDLEVYIDAAGVSHPLTGPALVVIARPTAVPLVQNVGGTYREDQQAQRRAPVTASTGAWTLTLPWPSETRYAAGTELWQVRRMNGSLYQGYIPEGIAGPLSLDTLVQTYGTGTAYKWQIVQAGTQPAAPITAVPGPAGPSVITTKGDLAVGNAVGAPVRLGAGADGSLPFATSAQSVGLQWRAIAAADLPAATATARGAVRQRELNLLDYPGADPTGATDSTAAIVAWLTDMLGGLSPSAPGTGVRIAKQPGFMPAGTYKLTAASSGVPAIDLENIEFLNIRGAGDATVLSCSGTMAAAIKCNGVAYSQFADLSIVGDGTETVTTGLSVQWDGVVARTCTRLRFDTVHLYGLKFINGIGFGDQSGSFQVDQSGFYNCLVTGPAGNVPPTQDATYWQNAYLIGSGVSGNIDNNFFYNPIAFSCATGFRCNQTKGFGVWGFSTQDNGADFYVNTQSTFVIDGGRSEGAGRFMTGAGGTTIFSYVDVRNVDWNGNRIAADGKVVQFDNPGVFNMRTCTFHFCGGVAPYMAFSNPAGKLTVILDGVGAETPLETFVIGDNNVVVQHRGFGYINLTSHLQIDKAWQGQVLLGTVSPPMSVVITDTGGGAGATATATANSAGVITAVTPGVVGAAYTGATVVTIADGGGTGATITPNIVGGQITSYTVTAGGSGYHSQSSGPVLRWGTLPTVAGTPATVDVALMRRSAGLIGIDGNLGIGLDGGPTTNTLSVYGPTAAQQVSLSWNDLTFRRTGGASNISQSGGQPLILQTTNGSGAVTPRLTIGAAANGVTATFANANLSVPNAGISTGTSIQPGSAGSGCHIWSGSGAPTLPGGSQPTTGDIYFRSDGAVGTTIYRCTTGGASPVWAAIL